MRADEKVTLSVPIHLIGIPDGVRNFGGVLDHVLRELEIEVLPADIPEHVDLDVTALTIGHSLFVRDLKVEKAECARPGYDCDVVSRGTVQRGRYGMDSWQLALSDRVTFVLRARLSEAPKP